MSGQTTGDILRAAAERDLRAADAAPALKANEVECQRCGTVAVNSDFCSCGEYLAWGNAERPTPPNVLAPAAQGAPQLVADLATEPETPAVSKEPSYRPPAPADSIPTLLTLRDPARPDDSGAAAVSVAVIPGTEVAVLATVRNQGEIVDQFDLRVEGLPDTWWSLSSEAVFLNPWGSSGDFEQEVLIRLHPPRASDAEAREWPVTVVARSRSLMADAAAEQATLNILPYQSTRMEVAPERRRGRRRARFDVTVTNRGNSPVEVVVDGEDTTARCPISIDPGGGTVPVGGSLQAQVRVDVPYPLIFARPLDHRLLINHHIRGVDADPDHQPARVSFQQRAWLSWWIPPAVALLAAFITMLVVMYNGNKHQFLAPNLQGRTIVSATRVLKKADFKGIGVVRSTPAPEGYDAGEIVRQVPEADALSSRGIVDVWVAAAPVMRTVPAVRGRTLAAAADALTAASLGNTPEPPSAGDDWVVIRQGAAPGSKLQNGTKVALAVKAPAPAKPKPKPETKTKAAAKPTPESVTPKTPAAPKPASDPKSGSKSESKPVAKITPLPVPPADLVFAEAISGQLYQRTSKAAQAARLTSPKYRLVTPTKTDDGYVAVQAAGADRGLMAISADGKAVTRIAAGTYRSPVYSLGRGLLAVISRDGRGGPADAGELCSMDLQGDVPLACAPTHGRRLGRPSWSPDGRRLLALASDHHGGYNKLLLVTARGGDATRWTAPTTIYGSADIRSAVWVGDDRIAVLVAERSGAAAHLRLLARAANGRFSQAKDFPTLTGSELAASGHYLALRRGNDSTHDGAIVLLDVDQARPRLRNLSSGLNPSWAK